MLSLGLLSLADASRADDARPNVVLFFSDDTPQRDYGCYGNTVVRTPNIDRLASQGMLFTNMYTTSPTCSPSRAALYTGLHPIRNGAHANHSAVKPGTKSLPHYLGAMGYRVVLIGKHHEVPAESFPFEYYAGDVASLLTDPDPGAGDKPLCLIYATLGSHVPWPDNAGGYDPAAVRVPPHLVDTAETREAMTRYYSCITATDDEVGRVMDLLDKHDLSDRTVLIFTADHGTDWPREKHNLYDAGIKTPFIVRWPGRVAPGSRTDALASFVDFVPTCIDLAGGDPASVVRDAGVEPLDGASLAPVLRGESTGAHDAVFASYTWCVMHAYPMRAARTAQYKYIRNLDAQFRYTWPVDTGWWGERGDPMAFTDVSRENWSLWNSWLVKAQSDPATAAYLKSLQFRPKEELYDVSRDPDEMRNLADDPAHAAALADMRSRLDAWMQQQGDDGSSAYHGEAGANVRFIDQFYARQKVVNARLYGKGLTGGATVELLCPLWQAQIHYTLDGSEPTRDSPRYVKPFDADPPVAIKARAFYDGGQTPVRTVEFPAMDFRFHYKYHYKPESF
jgi:uncharacterized sulfatase